MKAIFVAGALLGIASGVIQAQDIPPKQKEAAERAFADGMDYYVWYEGPEPITATTFKTAGAPMTGAGAMSGFLGQFTFRYLAKDEKALPPYRADIQIRVVDRRSGSASRWRMTGGDTQPKTRTGTVSSMAAGDSGVIGSGEVEVFLTEPLGKKGKRKGGLPSGALGMMSADGTFVNFEREGAKPLRRISNSFQVPLVSEESKAEEPKR